jgi:hypothetical protein
LTVLGNTGGHEDIPAVLQLINHDNAMVAEHARWAEERIRQRLDKQWIA